MPTNTPDRAVLERARQGDERAFEAVVDACGGLVLGLAWHFRFTPMKKQIRRQDNKIAELEAKIQEGRAAKQRLPQFREEVRRLELELEKLLRILPPRRNVDDLLRRIRSLACDMPLALQRRAPRGELRLRLRELHCFLALRDH